MNEFTSKVHKFQTGCRFRDSAPDGADPSTLETRLVAAVELVADGREEEILHYAATCLRVFMQVESF